MTDPEGTQEKINDASSSPYPEATSPSVAVALSDTTELGDILEDLSQRETKEVSEDAFLAEAIKHKFIPFIPGHLDVLLREILKSPSLSPEQGQLFSVDHSSQAYALLNPAAMVTLLKETPGLIEKFVYLLRQEVAHFSGEAIAIHSTNDHPRMRAFVAGLQKNRAARIEGAMKFLDIAKEEGLELPQNGNLAYIQKERDDYQRASE